MKREPEILLSPQRSRASALGWLQRWHRRLAWPAAAAVLLWGLSGMLHPLMSALSPTAQPLPPAPALPAGLTPVLPAAAGIAASEGKLQSLRLRMLGDTPAWRLGLRGSPEGQWFDARSGSALPATDRQEAERLARALAGDASSPVRHITPVTQFSRGYPAINKILPVWRVEFAREDGLVAFVDTEGARLASLSDSRKRLLMPMFASLHTWSWASDPVKQLGMTALLLLVLASSAGGIAQYVLRARRGTLKPGQAPLRRWHRTLGITIGAAGIVLATSGLAHLWLQHPPYAAAAPAALPAAPALAAIPAGSRELIAVKVQDSLYWLQLAEPAAPGGEHQHHAPPSAAGQLPQYLDSRGIPQAGVAERHATALLQQVSHGTVRQAPANVVLVRQFAGEYGFFQKRLPVYRIDLGDEAASSWYIEPATGAFSTRIDRGDRLEGWVFAYLHKWHWLDPLGRPVRDILLASAAGANVLLAMLGLLLWRRKQRTAPHGNQPAV
ncbi:hypothetical protein [Chitinilyticum piscinae]|uniref:PepSY domain-containing protein n=1 Tax=Chitinilyticum piscinae TaxID=2866724 RepID=A0A8J7K9R2_9NEIS|nr:hypothetical protein [Chitinilyticum piscinae]MBE9608539.1 hypothetical protein [Chitinilyticum piscinae]